MARKPSALKIHVEGRNDLYALVNLLIRHGVNYDQKPWPDSYPEFAAAISDSDDPTREAAGVEAVLQAISDEVPAQAGRTVGFVLDADDRPIDRWAAIRSRLASAEVVTLENSNPVEELDQIQPQGFIGISKRFKTRVGVWMMPDNHRAGALEEFLLPLIPEGSQSVWKYAVSSTGRAVKKLVEQGTESFAESHRLKANLACWLAWQKNPGRPYGTAMRAKYFNHDGELAAGFVNWFKTLFQIDV